MGGRGFGTSWTQVPLSCEVSGVYDISRYCGRGWGRDSAVVGAVCWECAHFSTSIICILATKRHQRHAGIPTAPPLHDADSAWAGLLESRNRAVPDAARQCCLCLGLSFCLPKWCLFWGEALALHLISLALSAYWRTQASVYLQIFGWSFFFTNTVL